MERREHRDIEQHGRRGGRLRKLALVLAGLTAMAMVLTLWRSRPASETEAAQARRLLKEVASRKATTAADRDGAASGGAEDMSPDGDDLKVIEGIGPRIEEVLKAAGVTNYAALAELRPGRLQTIMREAGKRMAKPDTWPEQARLAADGEWQALKELQDSLKRGVPG
ncbi:MAG: hypothetical protein H0U11_01855 [Chloroflexi bacterium]|nr:hypothetical protein [Chloroflexota bacterium]